MDIAALFLQLSNINYTQDWGWMYAAFTGLIGEKSAGIPVKMSVVDPEDGRNNDPRVKLHV